MSTNLIPLMEELSALPSTAHPFLSMYLDLKPDGSGRRPALQLMEQELDRISERLPAHGAERESFDADRERIVQYVGADAPTDTSSVAIFACHGEGVWHSVPLYAPVETYVVADSYPHLFQLARMQDDYEPYAVVMADSQKSRIFVVALNRALQAGASEASEPVNRTEVGGWSQARYQRHVDNIVKLQTKDIAEQLSKTVRHYDIEHIILAGNNAIRGTVREVLPKELEEKVLDWVNLDMTASVDEMLAAVEPLITQAERDQEAGDVDTLEAQVNTIGGLGVAGVEATAEALSKGQVRLLIMLEGFQAPGSRNPQSGFLYSGMQTIDPYDGTQLEVVDLKEAFTARAMQQGATIQVVETNQYLEDHDGVGALLWYRDDQARANEVAG